MYGARPEGVPIVHTDDRNGNPDKVRIIPEERYRRLHLYANLPVDTFADRTAKLTGISITQQSSDGTDLALEFLSRSNDRSTRKVSPNTYKQMPVVFRRKSSDHVPNSVQGGVGFETDSPKDDSGPAGTVTLIAYDESTGDEVLVATDHTTAGEEQVDDTSCTLIAENNKFDYATDTSRFVVVNGADVAPLRTINVPDISGAWRFAGLADTVGQTDDGDSLSDGGTVAVETYGAASGRLENTRNNTKRYGTDREFGELEYQADMVKSKATVGDSGAPWVDANGKLLAQHFGESRHVRRRVGHWHCRSGITQRGRGSSLTVEQTSI